VQAAAASESSGCRRRSRKLGARIANWTIALAALIGHGSRLTQWRMNAVSGARIRLESSGRLGSQGTGSRNCEGTLRANWTTHAES